MQRGCTLTEAGLVIVVLAIIAITLMALCGPMVEALMKVTYTTEASHGLARHPETYHEALRCFNKPEAHLYTLAVRDSKKIDVCMLGNLVYFRVWKKVGGNKYNTHWSEITAYHHDKIESLAQLNEYAKEVGYQLHKGILQYIPPVH